MLVRVLLQEMKKILKSYMYWGILIIIIIFVVVQTDISDLVHLTTKPEMNLSYYGMVYSDKPDEIMKNVISNLVEETSNNLYVTYPAGFYKAVSLSEEEQKKIIAIIEQLTKQDFEILSKHVTEYYSSKDEEVSQKILMGINNVIDVDKSVDYEDFKTEMNKVGAIIGKGSYYEISEGYSVPKEASYEDALSEYEQLCKKDKITGAVMRYICDYVGIIVGLLSVFFTVFIWMRDENISIREVIYSKKINSWKLLSAKYLALVLLMFIPILLIALCIEVISIFELQILLKQVNIWAFASYTFTWILPEIMFIVAITLLLCEMFGKIVAVAGMMFVVLAHILVPKSLIGDFGYKLIIRWNNIGMYDLFVKQLNSYYTNRIIFFILSIIFVIAWIYVYDKGRIYRKGINNYA